MAGKSTPFNMELFFQALGDNTRLRLLNLMGEQEICVCYFVEILAQGQPKISRHLAYLRRSGLVTTSKRGKWVMYSLAQPQNTVHATLVNCVKNCFGEIEFLKQDATALPACCTAPCQP